MIFKLPRKWWRALMFSEVNSLVKLAKKKVLQPADMPALPAFLGPRAQPNFQLDTANARTLVRGLFSRVKRWLIPALALNLTYALLNLAKPVLVNGFIARVGLLPSGQGVGAAVAFAVAIGGVSFLGSLAVQHYYLRVLETVQMVVNVLNRLIYQHSLVLTHKSRGDTQLGDLVNHMSSDSDAVSELPMALGDILNTTVSIVGSVVLLFYYLGSTAFLSVGLLMLMVPLSRKVARSFSRLDEELMHHRDDRVTLMSQILNGIRVVKYFTWEKSVNREVAEVRRKELHSRRRLARAEAVSTLSYVAISTLVLFATLTLHVYLGHALTPALAFTCVAIFALLEEPFSHLSELISKLAVAFVGADRICRFLHREKLPYLPEKSDSARPGVEAENLHVKFDGSDSFSVSAATFRILPGESVAIVGPVGSGKSTLLHALLREVPLKGGSLSFLDDQKKLVVPRIAYVPQEAFIVNDSLKKNILFGGEEEDTRLRRALFASCLESDLTQLPAGLHTEIGEKGVNLSGGQKQRVSLARAIMHEPTIALLDDPLSAVDARTEEQLIERLLFGEWREITRVVVTHRLAFLARFDKVIFLVNGQIKEQGTLDEISARSPEFRAFYADSARAEQGSSLMAAKEKEAPLEAPAQTESRVTDDEDRAIGAVKGGVYLDYIKALGGQRPLRRWFVIALLFAASIVASLLPLAQKSWLAFSANTQSGEGSTAGWVGGLAGDPHRAILVYGAIGLLILVAVLVNKLSWLERGMAAGRDMHDQMLRAVLRAPLRFFDSTPTGRILQRFSRDVEAVDIQLQWSFEITVKCLVSIGTALFLILGVLPLLALVVLPVLAVYYLLQRDYRIPAREAKRLDSISRSPRFAHFKETLQGLVVIRSFGKMDFFLESFHQKLEHGQRMFRGHYLLNRWFSSRIPLLGGLVSSATALGLVYYAHRGLVSPGVAGLVIVYAIALWESLNWAVRIFAEVEARMTSVERLKFYAQIESEQDLFRAPAAVLEENWPARGEIIFEKVQVRYAPYLPPVLREVSLRVPAGARVGVIGRTGSGKSTLLQALYRCMEVENGEILLDGVNIASVPLEKLRGSLAIIPQDPTLFLGTLRSNLDRYREYTDEEIWEALRKARLMDLVRSLPGELQAPVKENGANFSQGQRQLLCLARALLANARVIVMDEATASVDVQTDGLVQEVVRESCQNVTMIIIAHRLGTVADCELVFELRAGKLHRTLSRQKTAPLATHALAAVETSE